MPTGGIMKSVSSMSAVTLVAVGLLSPFATAQAIADRSTPGIVDLASAREFESLLGREVRTRPDGDNGRIIDLLTDREGKLQAAVVELGGFLGIGTRKIAIEWGAFKFDRRDQRPLVILELSREQLRAAPEYSEREPQVVRNVVKD
jgi:hypothetical protein